MWDILSLFVCHISWAKTDKWQMLSSYLMSSYKDKLTQQLQDKAFHKAPFYVYSLKNKSVKTILLCLQWQEQNYLSTKLQHLHSKAINIRITILKYKDKLTYIIVIRILTFVEYKTILKILRNINGR